MNSRQRSKVSPRRIGVDFSNITRAALVLFNKTDEKTHVLLGKGANGLTTLGGRTRSKESWIDCLVREVKEETRGILDYAECKRILQLPPAQAVAIDNCAYVFFPVELSVMKETAERFIHIRVEDEAWNEMSSIEIVDIDWLIEELVVGDALGSSVFNPTFKEMFLDIGYDVIRGNACNYITENVAIEAEISCRISEIPRTICLSPINDKLPVVYGFSKAKGLYITDQYYMQRNGKRLFRSGWFDC
jgi:8-oxo-dGTP pyrophosphatase MutT (NUDIX family)